LVLPDFAAGSDSALAVSPEAGTSGFSQALSLHSEDAELSVGPGMAPKAQEKMRRKSVSSKAAEVVTIGMLDLVLGADFIGGFEVKQN
jgi:hypothetical protein